MSRAVSRCEGSVGGPLGRRGRVAGDVENAAPTVEQARRTAHAVGREACREQAAFGRAPDVQRFDHRLLVAHPDLEQAPASERAITRALVTPSGGRRKR